ncbi:UNVERIFIED_CONTAM: signal transduction histidine kinase [Acetivibrio alkalicellulosi]
MKSIAHKLWVGMMLLVVVVLLLLWFFQIVFLEKFYIHQRVNEVKNRGFSILKDFNKLDIEEMEYQLDSFIYDYNLSLDLIDIRGNILYSNGQGNQRPMMVYNQIRGELLKELLAGEVITTRMVHPRFNSEYMVIGMPLFIEDKLGGFMLINMPLVPVEDTTYILKGQLIYISLILFLVSIIISFIISRSFTKPLLKITKATGQIATGDLSVKIETKSKDEIGELSEAINHLVKELSKIENLRRDLIANVSHELRTPLSLIRGYAETIKDVSGDNKDKRERQLEIIIDETKRLSSIVNDILDLSQMQSGNFSIKKEQFDINVTILSVINKYEILSMQIDVKIIFESFSSILVNGDEARIEQVLSNLINNALNYSEEGGIITIKLEVKEKTVRVFISDTGKGIDEKEINYIWDKYYKAEKSKIVGTGLGLAIVKNILDAHGNEYGVESVSGKGTTFWFELKLS